MRKRLAIAPKWPRGPVAALALGGMIAGFTLAYVPQSRTVVPMSWLYQVGIAVFRSDAVIKAVMQLGFVAHVVESVILFKISQKNGNTLPNTMGWVGLCMLFGYPAIAQYWECKAELLAKTKAK